MKMDVIRVFTNISVLLILGFFNKGMTAMQKNWFEAQSYCANRNKTLTSGTLIHGLSYWTVRYQRISHWIKLIGCFEETVVTQHEAVRMTMEDGSAGYCQEICLKSNKSVFAIKNSTCLCLRNRVTGSGKKPSRCNITCSNNIDSKFTTECGGETAYNVYGSRKDFICDLYSNFPAGECVAIQCKGSTSSNYYCSACSTINRVFCHPADSFYLPNSSFNSWENSMARCKNTHFGYLPGNLPLSSALNACTIIKKELQSPTWIGVAKQRYQGLDQGYPIALGEQSMYKKCEKCRNNQCSFIDCTNTENIEVYCSDTKLSTDTYHPSTTTTSLVLGIVIPIILILLGTAVGIAVYFWRQRKQETKSNGSEKLENNRTEKKRENEHIHHEEKDVHNSSYFFLEPKSSYEQSDNDIMQAENPYNEANEGDYDHLGNNDHRRKTTDNHDYDDATCRKHESRNKESKEGDYDHLENNDSRRKVTDETYCHTSSKQLGDSSDYDVANHTGKHDLESTYDHASAGLHLPNDSNYDYSELKEI